MSKNQKKIPGPIGLRKADWLNDLVSKDMLSLDEMIIGNDNLNLALASDEPYSCSAFIAGDLMRKMILDLQNKKNQVVKEKFAEKGYGNLIDQSKTTRFKKVLIESHPDREEWWVDNGTDEGLLIVTFLNPSFPQFNQDPRVEKFTMELKYF